MLARGLPGQPIFDSLENGLISDAEASRNREVMCEVYSRLSHVYFTMPNHNNYVKAKGYIDKCFAIASESGLSKYKAGSLSLYATYYRLGNDKQKALDYNNQAIAIATDLGNDSLLCQTYLGISATWQAMANKLSQFQSLLTARSFAEKTSNNKLLISVNLNLGQFYLETEQYEKSKDYYALAIQQAREGKNWYWLVIAMQNMAQTYISEGGKEVGLTWYNKAGALCDSLRFTKLKTGVNLALLNYYFNYETPQKGLAYLNAHPELVTFITDVGVGYQMNKLYAAVSDGNKQYDSAVYYMKQAAPFEYGQPDNFGEKYSFTLEWANILKDEGSGNEVMQKLLYAKTFADSSGDLEALKDISQRLDSAYQKQADYKNAFYYYSRYNHYKDTLENLGKQKDLLNIEIANANKRAEQQKEAEQAALRKRNDLEYMGITAAIATIFIVLVLFGVFKISPAVIKGLGFFAFIFLFEFITLLLDEQIHEITGGEPWKVLAIKILLIALLLPLHHKLEEKVLHYLTSKAHKLKPGFSFLKRHSEEEKVS